MNRGSRMIQSCYVLEYRSHRIHSEPKFKDHTILLRSRVLKSPDPFWTKVQGWYNPATFSMTEVTRSLLDICPGMIQSLFILEDRGLWITLEHMSWDDTIPVHSRWPRPLDHFRADAQGWYNPTATPLLPLSRKVFPKNTKLVSKVFKLYSWQRLRQHIII